MPFFPRLLYGRRMLLEDGGPNRDFLSFLVCDEGFAMHFLKDVGLLRSKVHCDTCGRDMTSAEPSIPEGFRWRCRRKVAGVKCSKSIKAGTWFQQSNLTFRKVLLITYDIVHRETAPLPKKNMASVQIPSLTWACSAGKPCWCSWRAVRKSSAVLTRSSKLTRASLVGESTIGDTLLMISGCLVVLNEIPAEHFLFPYRTEPLTPWWPL